MNDTNVKDLNELLGLAASSLRSYLAELQASNNDENTTTGGVNKVTSTSAKGKVLVDAAFLVFGVRLMLKIIYRSRRLVQQLKTQKYRERYQIRRFQRLAKRLQWISRSSLNECAAT